MGTPAGIPAFDSELARFPLNCYQRMGVLDDKLRTVGLDSEKCGSVGSRSVYDKEIGYQCRRLIGMNDSPCLICARETAAMLEILH